MTKITLSPTLPLTDFARAHWKELKFGPEAPLSPQMETIERRDLNWFGRCVKKMHACDLTLLNITKLVVRLLLLVSLVGIPLLFLEYRERQQQHKDIAREHNVIDKLNQRNGRINKRAAIVEKLQLQNFQQLQHLDLQGKKGSTGYIDFLSERDLSSNIMRGTDGEGRAFISLKLRSNSEKTVMGIRLPNPFVVTLFERNTSGNRWVWGSAEDNYLWDKIDGVINQKELDFFHQVISGQNPEFNLA
ncbi:MAG: hypothetical protein LLG04_10370 [Parachlamydia sp.]|nr:hypothetical protein [Parachlamydia sp.]